MRSIHKSLKNRPWNQYCPFGDPIREKVTKMTPKWNPRGGQNPPKIDKNLKKVSSRGVLENISHKVIKNGVNLTPSRPCQLGFPRENTSSHFFTGSPKSLSKWPLNDLHLGCLWTPKSRKIGPRRGSKKKHCKHDSQKWAKKSCSRSRPIPRAPDHYPGRP